MNIDDPEEIAKEKDISKNKEEKDSKDQSQTLLNKKRLRYKVIKLI